MAAFAKLTEAERERLEMLAEEAGEIVQACMKILRHGYSSFNPHDPKRVSNMEQLETELKELWTIYERMAYHSDLSRLNFHDIGDVWVKKLPYTHHQPGTVPVNHPPNDPLRHMTKEEREAYESTKPHDPMFNTPVQT